jgi:4-hydroxy-2-oxoglutarate aldolase
MLSLTGIIPPIPTPFDKTGEFYPQMLQRNLTHLNRYDLKGYLLLGSNGELVMLSEKERSEVLNSARQWIPDNRIFMAGTGCQSTKLTIELTGLAAKAGANVALILNPSYYKSQMTPKVLIDHYNKVADSSPIPIVVYNMPANSGMDMDAETIFQISQHPNIIGLKDSGGNVTKIGSLVEGCGNEFQILAGGAGFFLPALSVGAAGGILALANIMPGACIELHELFKQGKLTAAKELQTRIISLNTAITRKWGIPALKATMDMIGLYGGPVREPLLPVNKEQTDILKDLLIEVGTIN